MNAHAPVVAGVGMPGDDFPPRAVLAHAAQARSDVQQLSVLMDDSLVIETLAPAVLQIARLAIRDADNSLQRLMNTPEATPVSDLWDSMRRQRASVDALVSECLTLATGSLLLQRGADGGLCAVADRLLADVTVDLTITWQALTVPGLEDRTSYRTGVIALRCPARGFWSLPFALHELGHVIAQTLDTSEPGQASHNPVRTIVVEGNSPRQREELFADFFATFSLGPAYGMALMLTRFDPRQAKPQLVFEGGDAMSASHPSADKRMHLILETLSLMDRSAGLFNHPYKGAAFALRTAWESQVASEGISPLVDAASVVRLDHLAERFWSLASGGGPLEAARHRAPIGQGLEEFLLEGPHAAPAGSTIRDVVSKAWGLRFEGRDPDVIEERALALARSIIQET